LRRASAAPTRWRSPASARSRSTPDRPCAPSSPTSPPASAVGVVAARFHNALASAAASACGLLRERVGLETVVLSGGVFQNAVLSERTASLLNGDGFEVLLCAETAVQRRRHLLRTGRGLRRPRLRAEA